SPFILECERYAHERLLLAVNFRPPSPPTLGGTGNQSPPELGDLGGIPGFMQETFMSVPLTLQDERRLSFTGLWNNTRQTWFLSPRLPPRLGLN
ncbi:MAG TPA: hypothetical protein V6C85_18575, partial [Allocoleopsis sp.]